MNPPEYLLLDVDGVLQFADETSEEKLELAYNWITSHNEFVRELLSHPEFPHTQTGKTDLLHIVDEILPNHVENLGAVEYVNAWLDVNTRINQELVGRIPELPAAYLATNQDLYCGEFVRNKYAPHVIDSFISSLMGKSKPSAEFFYHILDELNTTPDNCVFIDDREANIDAAKAIGIRGILFQDNASLFAELKTMGLLS